MKIMFIGAGYWQKFGRGLKWLYSDALRRANSECL